MRDSTTPSRYHPGEYREKETAWNLRWKGRNFTRWSTAAFSSVVIHVHFRSSTGVCALAILFRATKKRVVRRSTQSPGTGREFYRRRRSRSRRRTGIDSTAAALGGGTRGLSTLGVLPTHR